MNEEPRQCFISLISTEPLAPIFYIYLQCSSNKLQSLFPENPISEERAVRQYSNLIAVIFQLSVGISTCRYHSFWPWARLRSSCSDSCSHLFNIIAIPKHMAAKNHRQCRNWSVSSGTIGSSIRSRWPKPSRSCLTSIENLRTWALTHLLSSQWARSSGSQEIQKTSRRFSLPISRTSGLGRGFNQWEHC
jgi:hypothetical protein